jgi:hypothetical protein
MEKEKKLLNDLVNAWESLEGDIAYEAGVIEEWLFEKMKPEIDNIRDFLGRPNEKIINKGEKNEN